MENVITFNFWSIILAFGIFQGVFLMLTIAVGFPKKKSAFLLLGLIAIISANLVNYLLLNTHLYQVIPHATHLATPFLFLIGPVFYFYLKTVLQRPLKLKWTLSLHALPFLLSMLYFSPFFLLSGEDKSAILLQQQSQNTLALTADIVGFLLIQITQSLIYVFAGIALIKKVRVATSNTKLQGQFQWLIKFGYAFFGYWMMDFLCVIWYFTRGVIDKEAYYLTMLAGAGLIHILAYFSIRQNRLFSQLFLGEVQSSYQSTKTTATELERDLQVLMAFIEKEKPFLDSDLSLTKLAEQVQIPQHRISQVLNTILGKGFYEFMNEWRFKEAKRLLTDPKKDHLTILAIAYEAGFGNKNTFNKVFKQLAGLTPSQYRKSVVKID